MLEFVRKMFLQIVKFLFHIYKIQCMRVTVNFGILDTNSPATCIHNTILCILSIDFLHAYSFICMYFLLPNIKWLFWTANIANIIINIWLINRLLTDVSMIVTDFTEQFNLSALREWMLVWLCCSQTKPLEEKIKNKTHFWTKSIQSLCGT